MALRSTLNVTPFVSFQLAALYASRRQKARQNWLERYPVSEGGLSSGDQSRDREGAVERTVTDDGLRAACSRARLCCADSAHYIPKGDQKSSKDRLH